MPESEPPIAAELRIRRRLPREEVRALRSAFEDQGLEVHRPTHQYLGVDVTILFIAASNALVTITQGVTSNLVAEKLHDLIWPPHREMSAPPIPVSLATRIKTQTGEVAVTAYLEDQEPVSADDFNQRLSRLSEIMQHVADGPGTGEIHLRWDKTRGDWV